MVGHQCRRWRRGRYNLAPDDDGRLYSYTTTNARLPVGAAGLGLVVNADEVTGLRWGAFGIPSKVVNADYTLTLPDNGYGLDHEAGAGAGDTYTIPANASLALPIGFTFSVFNQATDDLTVEVTSDTLLELATGTSGSVLVEQYGSATFRKVANTTWWWWGGGAGASGGGGGRFYRSRFVVRARRR